MNNIQSIILSQKIINLDVNYDLTQLKNEDDPLGKLISVIIPINKEKEYDINEVYNFFHILIKDYIDMYDNLLTESDKHLLILYCLIRYFGLDVSSHYDFFINLYLEIEDKIFSSKLDNYKQLTFFTLYSIGALNNLILPESLILFNT